MTATIRTPDPRNVRRTRRQRTRFASMEALGFIESPATVSNTWFAPPSQPFRAEAPEEEPRPKRGAHERTVADVEPNDTTQLLVRRNIRWGLGIAMLLLLAALAIGAAWLWQRPAAIAEAAVSDVIAAAEALEPELLALRDLNTGLLEPGFEASQLSAQAAAVDANARDLFEAAATLPGTASTERTRSVDATTAALDASRYAADTVAYRTTVTQILAPPELQTDPDLIAIDDAVRAFGDWQQRFNDIRSALPTGSLSAVSAELGLIAGNLESIMGDYVDGLVDDEPSAAASALNELGTQLSGAETLLNTEVAKVQRRVEELIGESLSSLELLLG